MNNTSLIFPITKRFGTKDYSIRPLHLGDQVKLQSFFTSHTSDTIYERYGCYITTMTDDRATTLVTIEPKKDFALGIFALTDGIETLYAVGRYLGDKKGSGAELAFVVHEKTRRQGMAQALLKLLIKNAQECGLSKLWAQIHIGNDSMIGVFQREGFTFRKDVYARLIYATKILEDSPN